MSAGNITRRGERSWRIKFDVGHDPVTGKRRTQFVTVKGTKKQAQAELTRRLAEVDNGTFANPGKLTLGAWLDKWLAGRQHSLALKTNERYSELIEGHIKPKLGSVLLGKVATLTLNEFYADRLTQGRLNGKGGLSARTVRQMDRVLHRAFKDAIKARLLAFNPVDYVERPKVEKRPKNTLSDAELGTLLED